MYEEYTRQALPSREYRELLGSAICVFNSNNAFIIENILRNDVNNKHAWFELIDRTSGQLREPILETITRASNGEIACLFNKIVEKRNRIIHSFQITDENGEQLLCTKDNKGEQCSISEGFLLGFIKQNEDLSCLLHNFRGF